MLPDESLVEHERGWDRILRDWYLYIHWLQYKVFQRRRLPCSFVIVMHLIAYPMKGWPESSTNTAE